MTKPVYSNDSDPDRGRTYPIPGYEQEFVSSTTLLNIISKPAIIGAAAKRAGERAIKEEPKWHAIQQEKGDEKARLWISSAARDYGKYARSLGSAIHFAIECYDGFDGLTDAARSRAEWWWEEEGSAWEPDRDKYVKRVEQHLTQFCDFLGKTGASIVLQERTVFHPLYDYAGTLDAIVELDGKRYVADWKSGFVDEASVPLQLASYRHATHYRVDHDTNAEMPDYRIVGGLVLQLKPRSWHLFPVECGEEAFAAFLTAKRLWEWRDSGCKGAIGAEWGK
jgi:hypothetical protein